MAASTRVPCAQNCSIAPEGVLSRWGVTYRVRFCAGRKCAVWVWIGLLPAGPACEWGMALHVVSGHFSARWTGLPSLKGGSGSLVRVLFDAPDRPHAHGPHRCRAVGIGCGPPSSAPAFLDPVDGPKAGQRRRVSLWRAAEDYNRDT